jgi:copper chaperone
MKTLKFQTNVKCGGCIATVTPHLNQIKGLINWSFDTSDPQKVLTAETSEISPDKIIEALKNSGYKANLITDK